MSKPSKSKKTTKTALRIYSYNPAWEKESWAKGWLVRNRDSHSDKKAYCILCAKPLRAHVTDLKSHKDRDSHIKKAENINVEKQPKLSSVCSAQAEKDNNKKQRDLKIATFIAAHASIKCVDHLTEILQSLDLKDLHLHRTKCSNLIKNVIAPNLLKELIVDIGESPYSLIIDESTDVAVLKYLCLCVKYFSVKQNRIVTDYLGLVEVEKATADILHQLLIDYCKEVGLKIENLIGLGTDGGSNLCGRKHSVFTLLKDENPKLQLVRCISHALNNAASAAANHFPANVEYLCREVYNWFGCSSLRQAEYKKTWDLINTDVEGSSNVQEGAAKTDKPKPVFRKFVQLSKTRWLVRYNVVKGIVEHHLPLKTHFIVVVNTEKDYTARLLSSMLNDDTNYLYLIIIKPILGEINYVNASFQCTNVDLGTAYDELKDMLLLLAKKIMKPSFLTDGLQVVLANLENELAYLPTDKADYGIDYNNALPKSTISSEQKVDIETRAFTFIKSMLNESAKRLPDNLKFYQKLNFLSPDVCLSHTLRPQFSELPFFDEFVEPSKLSIMENQWNKLLTVQWASKFGENVLKSSYDFWPTVFSLKNAGGIFVFRELAFYALTLLSLPSSNAVVERVFSIMNAVKTKIRSRMLLKMLDALLRIRMRFYANGTCCKSFVASDQMLKDFNYKVVYEIKDKTEEKDSLFEEELQVIDLLENFDIPCINIPEV